MAARLYDAPVKIHGHRNRINSSRVNLCLLLLVCDRLHGSPVQHVGGRFRRNVPQRRRVRPAAPDVGTRPASLRQGATREFRPLFLRLDKRAPNIPRLFRRPLFARQRRHPSRPPFSVRICFRADPVIKSGTRFRCPSLDDLQPGENRTRAKRSFMQSRRMTL